MTTLNFDPDNTLSGGLFAMTPKEAIRLGIDLCAAVERAVGADGCHGGVWPGNITWADGQVAIGPQSRASITDMAPDELEFVSPEQFWSGDRSPASDVYSVALVLYTALNRGVKPFFEAAENNTPEERAAALQSRMKGEELPCPATAGRALGDVVLRAAAFRPEDRYATPGRLKAALESLPEGADVPAAVPVVPLSEEEKQNAPSYKVDKGFEETPPEKEKKPKKPKKETGEVDENMDAGEFRAGGRRKRFLVPALLIVAILAALFYLMRGCRSDGDEFPVTTDPAVTLPAETENRIHAPVQETPPPWEAPTETEPPEETEQPAETEPPAEPEYELVLADVSWSRARDLAEEKGGHLATVRNAEQLRQITDLAASKGARFVWLGAYRDDNGQFRFVTGELMDFARWDANEPSGTGSSGNSEDYVLLWDRANNGVWSYNDTVDDPVSLLPRTYRGCTAYVIQYDR